MQLVWLLYMQMMAELCWQLVNNRTKNEQKKMDMHSGRYYRLLLAVIGLSVRSMKTALCSASELAGQKRAEASKDQENVAETEKSEDIENSRNGQNLDEAAAENEKESVMDEPETHSQESESEPEEAGQPVKLVFSGDILLSDHG